MDTKALDRWLTSAPEFRPTVMKADTYDNWNDDLRMNERACDKCAKSVGWTDYDTETGYGVAFTDYLQLDEDDEVNRCEFCVHSDDWNESVR